MTGKIVSFEKYRREQESFHIEYDMNDWTRLLALEKSGGLAQLNHFNKERTQYDYRNDGVLWDAHFVGYVPSNKEGFREYWLCYVVSRVHPITGKREEMAVYLSEKSGLKKKAK